MEAENLRRQLHQKNQELKGNILVFVRELGPGSGPDIEFPNDHSVNFHQRRGLKPEEAEAANKAPASGNKYSSKLFNFDKAFKGTSSQEEVFEEVSPLIQSFIDGYNVGIFAYGQTGAGKSHTMHGKPFSILFFFRTLDFIIDTCFNF